MSDFNKTVWIISLLALGVVLEFIRRTRHIPVTLLDIILLPLSVLVIYIALLSVKNHVKDRHELPVETMPIFQVSLIIIAGLMMTGLGMWSIYMGMSSPLHYFSGVKGAVHGYSLIPLGAAITATGVASMWISIRTLVRRLS